VSQALKKAEKKAEIFIVRARIFCQLNQKDAGFADMRTAMSIDPDHPEIKEFALQTLRTSAKYYSSGIEAMRIRDYDQAIKAFDLAQQFSSNDFKIILSRAAAHRLAGNLQNALSDIQLATQQFAGNTDFIIDDDNQKSTTLQEPFQLIRQRSLIWNEFALKKMQSLPGLDEALDLFNKVIQAETQLVQRGLCQQIDFRFFLNRGDCYQAQGKPQKALEDYRRAFASNPSEESVCTRISLSYYQAGIDFFNDSKYLSSIEQLTKAIQLNPRTATYYQARGLAYYYQHQFNEARNDFQEALRLDPTLDQVRQRLTQFHAELPKQAQIIDTPVSPSPGYAAQIPRGFRASISCVVRKKSVLPQVNVLSSTRLVTAKQRRKRACDKLYAIRQHQQFY